MTLYKIYNKIINIFIDLKIFKMTKFLAWQKDKMYFNSTYNIFELPKNVMFNLYNMTYSVKKKTINLISYNLVIISGFLFDVLYPDTIFWYD